MNFNFRKKNHQFKNQGDLESKSLFLANKISLFFVNRRTRPINDGCFFMMQLDSKTESVDKKMAYEGSMEGFLERNNFDTVATFLEIEELI